MRKAKHKAKQIIQVLPWKDWMLPRSKAGIAPGSFDLKHSEQPPEDPTIRLTVYNKEEVSHREMTVEQLETWHTSEHEIEWLSIEGAINPTSLEKLGKFLGLHKLALEDVYNGNQRPKVEDYDSHVFVVVRTVPQDQHSPPGQISFFLGEDYLLLFQDKDVSAQIFDGVRDRIQKSKGKIRESGSDYLLYALLDTVVDHFFPYLEDLDDRLDDIEDLIMNENLENIVPELQVERRRIRMIRTALRPLPELIRTLMDDSTEHVGDDVHFYLRDCQDHVHRALAIADTLQEHTQDLLDLHQSFLSNRMNEVMKVLTIIASIFVPITFVAGIYGMNFSSDASPYNMPETNWYYGYPFAIGLMVSIAVIMLIFFRVRRWI